MKAEIFIGRNCLYYFRFVAANGQIIATSGDGYASKQNCRYALDLIRRNSYNCPVIEK